jgi:eukaryotic-like serine/threonine-protein kinase
MRPRRHLATPFFSSLRGRRLIKRLGIGAGAFLLGYLLAVFYIFPAPILSSDHAVPRVVDHGSAEARTLIEKEGFRARFGPEEPHPTAAKGTVIWQDPPALVTLPAGSSVQLTVSAGPAPVPVPDLKGLETPTAQQVLTAVGLRLGDVDSIPALDEPGVVVATRPSAGAGRAPGSEVALVVSRGPAEIAVPDVRGMTSSQARDRLEQAGLTVGGVSTRAARNTPEGVVIEQRPAPGTLTPKEGRVDLVLSRRSN